VLVHELIRDRLVDDPVLIQLCCGIPYGAPAEPATLLAMAGQLPAGAVFSALRSAACSCRSWRWRR